MNKTVRLQDLEVGGGSPVYVIAEIGINHNGEIQVAKDLIDVAHEAGCQAVKFQKRTPEISTPEGQKSVLRETPWGVMTYLDYKKRIEFGSSDYDILIDYASSKGLQWFASPWDVPSVQFLEEKNIPFFKIASASLTNFELLQEISKTGKPVIASTGMSTLGEIDLAVEKLEKNPLILLHSTSTYPLSPDEANLRMIPSLAERYDLPIGYSGHETGLQISLGAVALGAAVLERHITLDRSMWGTDHAASLEPGGLSTLVRDIRILERAFGDGTKRVYESERPALEKLRGTRN